jgi:hypothetical protein
VTKLPTCQLNFRLFQSELFGIADGLKAAILTCVASILSRGNDDLTENFSLFMGHLNEMRRRLGHLQDGLSNRTGVSLIEKVKGNVKELDQDLVHEMLGRIVSDVGDFEESLGAVLESSTRQGVDDCCDKAGLLGLSINFAIELISGKALPLPPTYWVQFFSDAMNQLSSDDAS